MEDLEKFNLLNSLNAEKAQLLSNLSASSSDIGDWKVIKIYEARMSGADDPYNFNELLAKRNATRERINEIEQLLARMESNNA